MVHHKGAGGYNIYNITIYIYIKRERERKREKERDVPVYISVHTKALLQAHAAGSCSKRGGTGDPGKPLGERLRLEVFSYNPTPSLSQHPTWRLEVYLLVQTFSLFGVGGG